MEMPNNKAEIIPWLLSGWRLAVLMTLAIVALLAVVWAMSGNDVPTGKGKDLVVNESIDQGKNAVVANLVTNQQQVVNNATNVSNQAGNALNVSINRPSTQFNSNRTVVNDRFCRDFADDPSCH